MDKTELERELLVSGLSFMVEAAAEFRQAVELVKFGSKAIAAPLAHRPAPPPMSADGLDHFEYNRLSSEYHNAHRRMRDDFRNTIRIYGTWQKFALRQSVMLVRSISSILKLTEKRFVSDTSLVRDRATWDEARNTFHAEWPWEMLDALRNAVAHRESAFISVQDQQTATRKATKNYVPLVAGDPRMTNERGAFSLRGESISTKNDGAVIELSMFTEVGRMEVSDRTADLLDRVVEQALDALNVDVPY